MRALDTEGLLTREEWDGTFYICPGCGKDIRVGKNYMGDSNLINQISHTYPCEWYKTERYRRNNRDPANA